MHKVTIISSIAHVIDIITDLLHYVYFVHF